MVGSQARATVLILYAHPLLGIGLEKVLAAEADLDVTALDSAGPGAEAAMRDAPDVVILERGAGIDADAVLTAAPGTLLIDVGVDANGAFAIHREALGARAEGIVAAIRTLRFRTGAALPVLASLLLLAR